VPAIAAAIDLAVDQDAIDAPMRVPSDRDFASAVVQALR
jgi:hypothetical protein